MRPLSAPGREPAFKGSPPSVSVTTVNRSELGEAAHRQGIPETASNIRDALEEEREKALARIHELHGELNGIIADVVDTNADDEHDPEGPTIAYERARVTALLAEAQSHLGDLNEALARLESGDYSICETCGRTIPTERLQALPACRTCIACAVGRSASIKGTTVRTSAF